MKKLCVWIVSVCLLLAMCSCAASQETAYAPVTPVGEVPAEFADIVAENRFGDVRQVGDKLVRVDSHLTWVDMAGNVIASYEIPQGGYYSVKSDALLSTSDGGMLLALGFQDRYLSETDTWASEAGVSSLVIKLDAYANVEWQTELDDVEGAMLWNCIETNDGYCFFGQQQTPETKRLGVYSRTDLSVLVLDRQGRLVSTQIYGGSDYDDFYRAEMTETGYAVYTSSQSDDGLFEGSLPEGKTSASWRVLLDEAFSVTGLEQVEYDVLRTKEEPLTLDYGDFTLVVTENITGVYENQPLAMNFPWYYYETVYSAWQDGKLLWRAAVDSSPDYDAWVGAIHQNAE